MTVERHRPDAGEEASQLAAVEELAAAVEELRTVESELERQNEELAALQAAADAEATRYRTLFDLIPVPCITTGPTGRVVEANAAAARALGVDPRFLLDKPLAVHVDMASRREFRHLVLELQRGTGATVETKLRMRRRNRVPFDAAVVAAPTADGIQWAFRDVTDEAQAERRAWELNAELERRVTEQAGELTTIVEQLPVGVAVVDARTHEIRLMNRRGAEIVGRAPGPGETLGSYEVRAADGSPLPEEQWPAVRALRGEHVAAAQLRIRSPAGERVLVASAAPVVGPTGEITAAVNVFDDVTARELRERADRDFVSNAAHQLRTPLTAIASVVAALQGGAKDIPEERDRFLAHLERETDRLARLGRAMLTLARAQRGDEEARLAVVALRPVLDAIVMEVEPKPDVAVEVECDADVAAITSPELLEEALANLVGNAVGYTDAGTVAIRAARVDGVMTIEIADTGRGIDESEQPRVFDRFYRPADGSRGFGLGLPIARAAIEAAGGKLQLESEVGVGTTVRVELPAARVLS